MARLPKTANGGKQVSTLTHEQAARKNIPTAEYQFVAERMEALDPVEPVHYPRATPLAEGEMRERDEDHDPQIIWPPRPPTSNCSTTAPMRTNPACASPGRSRSRACRRIA
jgi:hypothetical protein